MPAVVDRDVAAGVSGLVENDQLTTINEKSIDEIIQYATIDEEKINALLAGLEKSTSQSISTQIANLRDRSNQGALANMAVFSAIMLIGYLCLILYFKLLGGYRVQKFGNGQEGQ